MNDLQKAQVREQMVLAIQVAGGASELARRLRVTTQAVCFWRDGKRKLPEALGARIEVATDGKVTRQRLWPNDWRDIWPELVNSEQNQPPALTHQAQEATENVAQEAAHV